jgi:hypothetical protein
MLTVKLVEHNGHEQIYSATHVWAEPSAEQPKIGTTRMDVYANVEPVPVNLLNPLRFANYGIVYVMNEAGQTVAKYWLGFGEGQIEGESLRDAALRRGQEARHDQAA